MTLTVLPKPDGHDLRNARAEKSESALDWLPQDAMYQASKAMTDMPPFGAMVVAWYVRNDRGVPVLKYCLSQAEPRFGTSLVADLQFELMLSART